MQGFFDGIHPPLLIAGLLNLAVVIVLSLRIRRLFQDSLTSVEEKSAGQLFFYRSSIARLFAGEADSLAQGALVLGHYLTLHFVVPLTGLGLFLRTDGNFLVVIVSFLVSLQLVQRLYPGTRDEEPDEVAPSGVESR